MKQRLRSTALKGTSHRVVIISCDEDSIFEQILCVVKDDTLSQQGMTAESILQEARTLLGGEDSDLSDQDSKHGENALRTIILLCLIMLFVFALICYLL